MSNYNLKAKNKETGEIVEYRIWNKTTDNGILDATNNIIYSEDEFNKLYEFVEDEFVDEENGLYVGQEGQNGIPLSDKGISDDTSKKDDILEDLNHPYGGMEVLDMWNRPIYKSVGNITTKPISSSDENGMTNNWIEELDDMYLKYDFEPPQGRIEDFITTLLEKQREEYVEMIEKLDTPNIYSEMDGIIYQGYVSKTRIINLIKSHDKTS